MPLEMLYHLCTNVQSTFINGTLVTVKAKVTLSMIKNVSISYIKAKDCKDGNLHAFKIINTEWVP
jgi:hypothetical protein